MIADPSLREVTRSVRIRVSPKTWKLPFIIVTRYKSNFTFCSLPRYQTSLGVNAGKKKASARVTKAEYEALAAFRYNLRQFLSFSESAAASAGLTPRQYQAFLAIKGFPGRDSVTIGELAEQLQIAHHSAVGLGRSSGSTKFDQPRSQYRRPAPSVRHTHRSRPRSTRQTGQCPQRRTPPAQPPIKFHRFRSQSPILAPGDITMIWETVH